MTPEDLAKKLRARLQSKPQSQVVAPSRVSPQALAARLRAKLTRPSQPAPQVRPQPKPVAPQVRPQSKAAPQVRPQSKPVAPQSPHRERPIAAEAFTGGGLFSLALAIEGIDVRETCELDRHAVDSLRENLHAHAEVCDALKWSPTVPEGGLDILTGGPPCQPWSKGGALLGQHDPRNMYPRVLEWIASAKPRIVCLENSNEIVKKKEFRDYFRDHWWAPLDQLGYEGTIWDLNAADFGTPQHRLRAFIVAWPKGSPWGKVLSTPPLATHGRPGLPGVKSSKPAPEFSSRGVIRGGRAAPRLPWVRAFDRLASGCCGGYALFDCNNLGNNNRACETCVAGAELPSHYDPVPDAARTRLTEANQALLAADKHGRPRVFSFPPTDIGGAEAWAELDLEDRSITRYLAPVVIANLKRGMPYGVITTPESPPRDAVDKKDPASVKRYVDSLARIGVRDAAKLQDVPQWYRFSGSSRDAFAQIGNGIPVNLGRAVARHLLDALGYPNPLPGTLAAERFTGLWPMDRLDPCGGFTGIYGYPGEWRPPEPQAAYDRLARPLLQRQAWDQARATEGRVKKSVARWVDRDGDGYPETYLHDPSFRPSSPDEPPPGFADLNEFDNWVQGQDEDVYARYAAMYGWND